MEVLPVAAAATEDVFAVALEGIGKGPPRSE